MAWLFLNILVNKIVSKNLLHESKRIRVIKKYFVGPGVSRMRPFMIAPGTVKLHAMLYRPVLPSTVASDYLILNYLHC